MSTRVDYDVVAARYGHRYLQNDYAGLRRALFTFLLSGARAHHKRVLDIGCGTGHWLRVLRDANVPAVGVDRSEQMLRIAQRSVNDAQLARARAEELPFVSVCFDRLICINALHHFSDHSAFFREARRILRPGGALLTVGLDPQRGADRWWVYDYFSETLVEDRKRYPASEEIRAGMAIAGFVRCETAEVQRFARQMSLREAVDGGFLDRTSTSQFMVISQLAYEAGVARVHSAAADAPHEKLFHVDLRLYGTTGCAA
ncbi:MAG TPA: class I SAM-dependent methyltransferase [Vicinamibacterales bacterium]|nr:class I SAM-dependent methyltransferase [Vicinamibacterales bacterium]